MKVAAKMRVLLLLCICFLFSCFLIPGVSAEESTPAEDLTCRSLFTDYTGFPGVDFLFDHKLTWGVKVSAPADLTMRSDEGIGSLYIRFATLYGEYVITDPETDTSHVWQQQFLHDFIDLEELFGYVPKEITLTFDHDAVTINELYAYSSGHVPADVQRWEAPKDGATDLILFSTHGDDEHLFFAGILPYYAGELGYQVQLVYMTDRKSVV